MAVLPQASLTAAASAEGQRVGGVPAVQLSKDRAGPSQGGQGRAHGLCTALWLGFLTLCFKPHSCPAWGGGGLCCSNLTCSLALDPAGSWPCCFCTVPGAITCSTLPCLPLLPWKTLPLFAYGGERSPLTPEEARVKSDICVSILGHLPSIRGTTEDPLPRGLWAAAHPGPGQPRSCWASGRNPSPPSNTDMAVPAWGMCCPLQRSRSGLPGFHAVQVQSLQSHPWSTWHLVSATTDQVRVLLAQ